MFRKSSPLTFLVLVGTLCALSGCRQNPSYFPYFLPNGGLKSTHAKPVGFGYYANFDPNAIRLELRPGERTNPVRTQHVMIATVYDKKGTPRRGRRVEWMIEGVGNLIEVDEHGGLLGRGYKTDTRHGVSYTATREQRITRGNDDPNDDFVIRPGQTWCIISSATEGDTHVRAVAPAVHDWTQREQIVTVHWVNAGWEFPVSASARAGTQYTFTTNVYRFSDRKPLTGYRVRYQVLDGSDAIFLPNRTPETVVTTDLKGDAHATITQLKPVLGRNRIGIEIIRPPDPTAPSGVGIVVAKGEASIDWLAPDITVAHVAPPTASIGQDFPVTTTITNRGKVETNSGTVVSKVPAGVVLLSSQPPAMQDAQTGELRWFFGKIAPNETHTIQAVYKAMQPGPVTTCATVTTEEGQSIEKCATTQVTTPSLKVQIDGPPTSSVGAPISYKITVTNPGSGPASNVKLNAAFAQGLDHASGANPLNLTVGDLAGGESRSVDSLVLTAKQPGQFTVRVIATADGGLTDQAEHTVVVQQGQVSLSIQGPKSSFQGRPADFTIRVTNPTNVPLTNVVLRDRLPNELAFVSATGGGQMAGNEVVWNLGAIEPNGQRILQLSTQSRALSNAATQMFIATASPNVQASEKWSLQIKELVALKLEMDDNPTDPVAVGKLAKYRIRVTNTGNSPDDNIELRAIAPGELQIVSAKGPAKESVVGQVVTFAPVNGLQNGQTLTYEVTVRGVKAGDARFRVELRSRSLGVQPVSEVEPTRVYDAKLPGPVPGSDL